MNSWAVGMILLAGFQLAPRAPMASQAPEPLFDLLADYLPDEQDAIGPVKFVAGPVAVPETGKNNFSLGLGYCETMSFFVLLKLDKDAVSRELKLNPLFFMPGSQGFLKINLTIKPRTKTMAVNLDPIPNLGLLRK
jgi:hypothetical protein